VIHQGSGQTVFVMATVIIPPLQHFTDRTKLSINPRGLPGRGQDWFILGFGPFNYPASFWKSLLFLFTLQNEHSSMTDGSRLPLTVAVHMQCLIYFTNLFIYYATLAHW